MKDERGVSMIVEYLILATILTVFVAISSLTLEDILKRSQVSKVVENQFSDVASQISAQIVDIAALYPSNGYLKAKVYMPSAIGDVKYFVGFEERDGKKYIYISSENGEFKKYLSLGNFANLKFENMSGITHSLQEKHELMFLSATIIYPNAVLKIRPLSVIVGKNITIDVSESYSPEYWTWIVRSWNGSEIASGDMGTRKKEVRIYWSDDIMELCNYNSSTQSAICNLTLEVKDSRGLSATDTEELLIAESADVKPELYIKEYAAPRIVQVGQPFELHIRLVGRGFAEGAGRSLSVVTVIDKSEKMTAEGNLSNATKERAKFSEFSYPLNPAAINVNFSVKNKLLYIVVYTTQTMPFWDSSQTDNIPSEISPNNAFTLYVNGKEVPRSTTVTDNNVPIQCINGSPKLSNAQIYGICYETIPDSDANWNLSVVVANPDPLQIKILVIQSKNPNNYQNYDTLINNQTYQYQPNILVHGFSFEPGYTENDTYAFVYVYIPASYGNKLNAWIKNPSSSRFSFCQDYSDLSGKICFITDVPAKQDISVYIVPNKIDASLFVGSVWMEKIDAAKVAAIKFINESLDEGDYKGLVDFNGTAYAYVVNSSEYLSMLTTDGSSVVEKIRNIVAGGGTNCLDALEKAKMVLTENTMIINGIKPLVVFLSGCDCGNQDILQVIQKADELKNTKIGDEYVDICTIGFGEKSYYNETLLRIISGIHTSVGVVECFYSAETLEELINAFRRIAGIYKTAAATNVLLTGTIPVNLTLYMYPEIQPQLIVTGEAECSLEPPVQNENLETLVNLRCSGIYPDDEVEIVLKLVAYETGYIPVISNAKISFLDSQRNPQEMNLPEIYVEVIKTTGSEVRIS